MNSIAFTKIADIPAFPDEYALITHSVANDGTLLFLFIELAAKDAVFGRDAGPSGGFARTKMAAPARFRLVGLQESRRFVLDLPLLDLTFPLVDIFPDGKVLMIGARSQWRSKDDYDLNGVVCDPGTGSTKRILLGDGIGRAYVDARGLIWVSYYDEGVYGNFGWGSPPGPEPVGSAGLACFSEAGEKIWEFPGRMSDCYALNVYGSEVVAYYYDDFPVCRISSDFQVTYWKTDLKGCRALAVTQSKALLSRQYDDAPMVGYLGFLHEGDLGNAQRVRLSLPEGSNASKYDLVGRGPHLYCFDASCVHRTTLA